jgi:hypothetical protein
LKTKIGSAEPFQSFERLGINPEPLVISRLEKLVPTLGGGEDVTKIGQHAYIVHFHPDPDRYPLDTNGLFNEPGNSIMKHREPGVAAKAATPGSPFG